MPLGRRHPRVEIVRHVFRRQDRDRMRAQMRVQSVADGVGLDRLGEIEMRDLPERMHAGIGAARALDRHALAGQLLDRDFDLALHGHGVGLELPAGKRRAVIFDQDFGARHDSTERRCRGEAPSRAGIHPPSSAACRRAAIRECGSRHQPQAMVSLSSSNVPGAPLPSPFVVRRTFTRTGAPSPFSSNQAPGNGDNPRL